MQASCHPAWKDGPRLVACEKRHRYGEATPGEPERKPDQKPGWNPILAAFTTMAILTTPVGPSVGFN